MATKNDYSLIRGRRMRVTRLDGCGQPIWGEDSMAVTDGFVSVAFTASTTDAEEIVITNANGQTCARDAGKPSFNGYELEITFCGVQPCIFEMLTGQPPVQDAYGDTVGFKMNTGIDLGDTGFALEIWAGVPGVACGEGASAGSYGYILVPFVTAGVIGDFTIENAAVNFVVTGAATADGNGWGVGPYDVVDDGTGACGPLPEPLDSQDALYVVWTACAPPEPTDGCEELVEPTPLPITGVVAGAPGYFEPAGQAALPTDLAALKADAAVGDVAWAANDPWAVGEYVVLDDASEAVWNGNEWVQGRGAAISAVTAGIPGNFDPANALLPLDLAALAADPAVGDVPMNGDPAWTTGQSVVLADASDAHWNGTAWTAGTATAAQGRSKK